MSLYLLFFLNFFPSNYRAKEGMPQTLQHIPEGDLSSGTNKYIFKVLSGDHHILPPFAAYACIARYACFAAYACIAVLSGDHHIAPPFAAYACIARAVLSQHRKAEVLTHAGVGWK